MKEEYDVIVAGSGPAGQPQTGAHSQDEVGSSMVTKSSYGLR